MKGNLRNYQVNNEAQSCTFECVATLTQHILDSSAINMHIINIRPGQWVDIILQFTPQSSNNVMLNILTHKTLAYAPGQPNPIVNSVDSYSLIK